MGLVEMGTDGLVNNDGSNVVGESDLAITKGGDVVPSINCVLPAVVQEVIPVKGKKVLDESMTQTTTTSTSEDIFTLGKIFHVKITGGAKRKILEEPVENDGIGNRLKVGEHGDVDVAMEVSGIISASPETRLAGNWAMRVKDQIGFANSFHVNSEGRSGGLLLLWTDEVNVTIKSFSKGHIDSTVQSSNGDFNDILSLSEKIGGADRTISAFVNFRLALSDCNLVDLSFQGTPFTWTSVEHGDFENSDHCPIILRMDGGDILLGEPVSRFYFEPLWLRSTEFQEEVQTSWLRGSFSHDHIEDLNSSIHCCGDHLKRWGIRTFGSFKKSTGQTRKKLKELYSRVDVGEVMGEIKKLEKSWKSYCSLRSRIGSNDLGLNGYLLVMETLHISTLKLLIGERRIPSTS
ncbi:Endonuclease/exonuclease/phosphatase [Parasponia andersonii]|uniref:Endonuclease/exonuclease/phosphatase n=1 Tax=Parasponia andersonii TaxID=3476 RepID=A0A2P5AVY6_PARAD|nr:Endonuclease/exonuclease/phosphatase [Parasponia andersonii]